MQERALNAKTSRLLVVDDDASNRHMLSRRLERRGYTVEVAENGHEALEKIHSAHYDLVLLDQMMPGMTGLDLLRLLRATYSQNELPVIMVTAVDQSESVVEALNEGANDYVVKPADLPVMDARIHIQLARAQAAQSVEQTALREQAQTRMTMAVELNRAIERNQLVAYYQPKVHLPTRAVVGFEALLRWQHPRRGLIAPGDFIPMAEETGSILPIGEWILNQACRQLRIWHDQFPSHPPLSMNVNLSVKQLGDPKLLGSVRAILDHTGIPPETLKLELTESSVIKEMELARGVLAGLRDMRVGLKLDDFGTGYSSLNYLRDLSFDSLKLDRSFISRVACDQESSAIVEAILSLARNLNMSVVAEGIENEEQLAKLVALGCDTGQGFLFARPLTAEHAGQLLLRRGEMTGERGE